MKKILACLSLLLLFPVIVFSADLSIFAAAGTKKPMDAVIAGFTEETGIKVIANFAASGGLYSQIISGQSCDLFLSADWLFIEKLTAEHKIIAEDKFLNDFIVLIVSEQGAKKVNKLEDLAKEGVIIAVADKRAPVGVYSVAGLKKLGLMDKVLANIRVMPVSVNQVAIMVQEDQVDAGLVYNSVATVYNLPVVDKMTPELTGEIIFGFGVLDTKQADIAKQFIEYAHKHSAEFEKYGWTLYK